MRRALLILAIVVLAIPVVGQAKPRRKKPPREAAPKPAAAEIRGAVKEDTRKRPSAADSEGDRKKRSGRERDPRLEAAGREDSGAGAAGNAVLQRGQRLEFDGRLVQGQTARSGAVYLFERSRSELRSMVRERRSYKDEIVRTVFPGGKR